MVTAIAMLISFALGAFTAVKAIQIGLRFKLQLADNKEPTLDDPIKDFFEDKEVKKVKNESQAMMTDLTSYVFGGE